MKFVSFNVNGIRAILQKDFKTIFESFDADIFSLNETKFTELEHLMFPFEPHGYHVYWTNSKVRKGYSGVAIFTKVLPLSVHYGLEEGKYDEEGRIITLEFEKFYYIACYVPNAGDGLKRLSFRLEFEQDMVNYLLKLQEKKPIIYAGDLNVAHQEIDLKNPKANIGNPGFTYEERNAFTALLSNGFIDSFRYLHPNEILYSWWSYRFHARENNAGWRIDYFVISPSLTPYLVESTIDTSILGSDHAPIILEMNL